MNTKDKIMLTALELFSKRGYKAVSVNDIAGELSLSKGALYKHYKNKREIFDSILKKMGETDGILFPRTNMKKCRKNTKILSSKI